MKILIVEDERPTRKETVELVKEYLPESSIDDVENVEEAVRRCIECDYDIALLDIELLGMNGIELAAMLNEINPSLKIAFLTAFNHYATEAFDVYALDYVLKPVRKERLYKCLDKLVAAVPARSVQKDEIKIRTFGKFEVFINQERVIWKRKKAMETLAYLVMNYNEAVHKEKLCDVIFEDQSLSKGMIQLHTVISHIRKLGIPIAYYDNCYEFKATAEMLDLMTFVQLYKLKFDAEDGDKDGDMKTFRAMASLYKGDFLEEESYIWSLPLKHKLRKKYLEKKQKLNL